MISEALNAFGASARDAARPSVLGPRLASGSCRREGTLGFARKGPLWVLPSVWEQSGVSAW